jgi:hypothetical protein
MEWLCAAGCNPHQIDQPWNHPTPATATTLTTATKVVAVAAAEKNQSWRDQLTIGDHVIVMHHLLHHDVKCIRACVIATRLQSVKEWLRTQKEQLEHQQQTPVQALAQAARADMVRGKERFDQQRPDATELDQLKIRYFTVENHMGLDIWLSRWSPMLYSYNDRYIMHPNIPTKVMTPVCPRGRTPYERLEWLVHRMSHDHEGGSQGFIFDLQTRRTVFQRLLQWRTPSVLRAVTRGCEYYTSHYRDAFTTYQRTLDAALQHTQILPAVIIAICIEYAEHMYLTPVMEHIGSRNQQWVEDPAAIVNSSCYVNVYYPDPI